MFMLDKWEELGQHEAMDKRTVKACRELADAMCAKIFNVFGMNVHDDGACLRVSGRGLTYLFPLRGHTIVLKSLDRKGTPRLIPRRMKIRKKDKEDKETTT
jgi:hypothetical protein